MKAQEQFCCAPNAQHKTGAARLTTLVRRVRALGAEDGPALKAIRNAGDDVPPRRRARVAREMHLQLRVTVTAALKALASNALLSCGAFGNGFAKIYLTRASNS